MKKISIFRFFKESCSNFIEDKRGVSAIIIALAAVPVFGVIGASVDLGRAYVLKSKLTTAADAAGLAAGRNIFASDAEIFADAQKYFDANFDTGYMGTEPIIIDASALTWDATREKVTLEVQADMSTSFLSFVNLDTLSVGTNVQIQRSNRGMELVMVLDTTGSMDNYTSGAKRIDTLKTAAKSLVDILYGNDETKQKLWVGVVPYTTQVNVGPQNIGFLSNADRDNILSNADSIFTAESPDTQLGRDVDGDAGNDTTYGWEGCVEMRDHLSGGTVDLTDDAPNNDFVPYFYSTRKWNRNKGKYVTDTSDPNKYCPEPILPLTAEATTVKSHIDSLSTGGATAVNVGLIWGWRAISPEWNDLWYNSSTLNMPSGHTALPLDYDVNYMDKVVILMTDGENTLGSYGIYHSYGRQKIAREEEPNTSKYHNTNWGTLSGNTSGSTYVGMDDTKTSQACENMKAAGIIVYTVMFVDGDSTMLSNCATSPKHAFVATSAAELLDNFNTIGEELSNLHISK